MVTGTQEIYPILIETNGRLVNLNHWISLVICEVSEVICK